MTGTALDRRITKTREACLNAFVSLLLTRGYEEISVSDVIAEADVGRSTFYDHYTGKEDLLRASLATPFAVLRAIVLPGADSAALAPTIAHFLDQRRTVRALLAGQTRTILVRALAEMIAPHLPALILPADLAAAQLAEGQLALLHHWLTGREAVKPERIADALVATTRASIDAMRV